MHLGGMYRCLCYISLLFLQELNFVKADVDVAVNQQASMSSTYTWTANSVQFSSAAFAVNGLNNQQTVTNNTNSGPGYYPRVCSVTLQDRGLGSWMVDLGATYHIISIKIFGVPDDSVANLSGFFNIFVMQSVSDTSPVYIGGLNAPLNNPYVHTQNSNIFGSVVKIAKNGNAPTGNNDNDILALCTVSVYSDFASTTTTTTSTTTITTPTTTITTPTTTITTPITTITTTTTATTTPTTPTIPSTTTPPITTTGSSGSDQPSTTSASPATITTMSVIGSSSTPATTSGITTGASTEHRGLSTGAIIGIAVGVGGGVLLIIIIIIIVICCRRCKSKPHHEKNGTLVKPVAQPNHFNYDTKIATVTEMPKSYSNNALTAVPTDIEMDVADDDGEGVVLTENDAYSSLLSPVKGVDIAVNCLPSYVKNEMNMEDPLLEEFRKIPPKQATSPITAAYKQANIEKNRYKNIVPYDYNRVQLAKQEGNIHSDYISASFIPGYKGVQNYYIACQGPKFQTVGDFWRMIYEYKCNRIVMITRLVENGKKKCEQYYGDERGHIVHQGDFKIETKSTDRYADFTIRTLQVTRTGNSNALTVRQFHYERWFDKETPEDTFSVLQFRHKIRSYDNIATGPMVVHCSAGVGRSGTFIALDILLEQVKHDDEVNVVKCVMELRQQRMYMIQTVDQYRFLHLILAEAVETGDVAIPVPRFFDSLSTMRSTSGEAGHSAIERQFMVLNSLKKDITPSDIGQNYENMSKNRDETLIPADDHRVSLTIPFPSLTTYINAVFLQGYRRRDSYIATQHPLPHTVIDFWSMVAAQRCHTIVSLVDNSAGDPSHATYLPPDNSSTVYGPVQVMCSGVVGSETRAGFVVKELHLSHSEKRYAGYMEPAILYHFQVKGWSPDSDLPPDHTAIMDLIAAVRRWQLRNEDSPIVIHCSDGVRQSCYLFAACRMVEQTSANNEVDVFTAVRSAHVVRPQAIASLKQYDSLYELASIYLTRDIGVEYSNT